MGFTYLGLLFIIAMISLAVTAAAIVQTVESRRQKEAELLFIGQQYAAALESYQRRSGKVAQPYPMRLEDLLTDSRSLVQLHHLRKLYLDPMTNSAEWGLLKTAPGGIVGVFSRSTERPLKITNFPKDFGVPDKAKSYRDWRFVAPSAVHLAYKSFPAPAAIPGPAPPDPLDTLPAAGLH